MEILVWTAHGFDFTKPVETKNIWEQVDKMDTHMHSQSIYSQAIAHKISDSVRIASAGETELENSPISRAKSRCTQSWTVPLKAWSTSSGLFFPWACFELLLSFCSSLFISLYFLPSPASAACSALHPVPHLRRGLTHQWTSIISLQQQLGLVSVAATPCARFPLGAVPLSSSLKSESPAMHKAWICCCSATQK